MAKNLEERVETLEKLVNQLTGKKAFKVKSKVEIGDTFKINGLVWKVIDITDKGYKCLAERLKDNMQFDSNCNDWKKSELREYLNTEFYYGLALTVGEENIIPFERDLLSLDGQTEYGTCEDKVSLLNVDEYRKYRSLLPNTNNYWWWLISPWSTPCNGYERLVAVVSSSGVFRGWNYGNDFGVRPVCIFSSSIFESEE